MFVCVSVFLRRKKNQLQCGIRPVFGYHEMTVRHRNKKLIVLTNVSKTGRSTERISKVSLSLLASVKLLTSAARAERGENTVETANNEKREVVAVAAEREFASRVVSTCCCCCCTRGEGGDRGRRGGKKERTALSESKKTRTDKERISYKAQDKMAK